jgi:hypothetical protein
MRRVRRLVEPPVGWRTKTKPVLTLPSGAMGERSRKDQTLELPRWFAITVSIALETVKVFKQKDVFSTAG